MRSESPARVIAVAAFEPELAAFREALPEVRAVAVGIGMVDAALGTSAILAAAAAAPAALAAIGASAPGRVELVILLGTCGVFRASDLGGIIVGSGALLADPAAPLGHAALPEPLLARLRIAETFGVTAELGEIATTLGVTTSDEAARALALSTQARAEHMETYAVVKACMMHGVRCAVILGAANVVGAQGRAQWLANHVAASARAAQLAAKLVRPWL